MDGVLSNRDLPSTSVGQARTIAIGCMFQGSPGQFKKGLLMSGIGLIFRWVLALTETSVSPDGKSSPNYIFIFIHWVTYIIGSFWQIVNNIPYSLSRHPYLYFAHFPPLPGFPSLPLPKKPPFTHFRYQVPCAQLSSLPSSYLLYLPPLPQGSPFPISLIRSLAPCYFLWITPQCPILAMVSFFLPGFCSYYRLCPLS